ncbi:MAG: hypothetical protein IPH78_04525 [Bacteroidetes bacterium]|nr:hypothetical protein [Bacteroidota bacterium]
MPTLQEIENLIGNCSTGQIIDTTEPVDEDIVITRNQYKTKWVIFRNITFNRKFRIQGADIGVGIFFDNCTFKDECDFLQVSAAGRDDSFIRDSKSLIFKKCTFEKMVRIVERCEIERDLSFEECSINNGVLIEDIHVSLQSVSFKKCKILGRFDMNRAKLKMGINITDCEIDTRVRFYLGEINSISIIDSKFKQDIYIWGCNVSQSITFNDGEYEDGVTLREILGNCSLNVYGGKFKNAFGVSYGDKATAFDQGIKKYYFGSCEFTNGFYVNGVKNLFADKPKVDLVDIRLSTKLAGDIAIRDLDIGLLEISGFNAKANLLFDSVMINQLKARDFINNAQLILSNVRASISDWYEKEAPHLKKENAIYLSTSNLGKAQLYQVNFDSFDKVHLHNVILSDITTSLVKWFSPQKLELVDEKAYLSALVKLKKEKNSTESTILTLATHYRSVREIYRQLKYAMNKQGDKPMAIYFQKWEMDNLRKEIELTQKNNFNDRLILWSSQSNDFGQSWIRPILFLLLFSFIFYIPIGFFGSPNIDFYRPDLSLSGIWFVLKEVFWSQIGLYPQLLNPAHSLRWMMQNFHELPGIIHFFDYLHRIVTAYFIFQIVSAFRKYVKS